MMESGTTAILARRAALRNKKQAKSSPASRNQAGRPTASELERRKGVVMEIATDLFVRNGYAATSLVDIARGAGVATRTLYQHFGDKEALFFDVILARDTSPALESPKLQPGDTLEEVLLRAAEYSCDVTYRERGKGLMRLMISESNRFPDFMRKVGNAVFARFRRTYQDLFADLAKAGMIPEGDHARSAELFIDLVLGSRPIMSYTNWNDARPSREDLAERVDIYIHGRFGHAKSVARKAPAKRIA